MKARAKDESCSRTGPDHIGVTYVATEGVDIHGFLTVAAGAIEIEGLPQRRRKSLPRHPLPVLRVARLAAAVGSRDRGVGRLLLKTAFRLAADMGEEVGCIGIVVDANEPAIPFHQRYGFEAIDVLEGASGARPGPTVIFLPLAALRPEPGPRS